jgi:hypothetical protein
MGLHHVGFLLFAGASLGQGPAGQDDYFAASTAAARELSRQVMYLQQAIIAVPRPPTPPGGDGLYEQTETINVNLIGLRQQLNSKAGREQLILSFDTIDGKLNQLLGEIQGMETWNPGLRMVVRRVRYAQHDVHFAIFAGDGAPATQAQVAYRQTLVAQSRTEDLLGVVRYVFAEQDALNTWNAEFANLKSALAEFQRMQNGKAPRAEVKQALAQADKAWAKLVTRFNGLPTANNLLLGSNFAKVDQVLDRLSRMFDVKDRRAALKDPFA